MARWITNAPNGKSATLNRGYRTINLNHGQEITDRELAEHFPHIFSMIEDDFQPKLTVKPEIKEEVATLESELLTEPAPEDSVEVNEEKDDLESEVLTEPAPVDKTKPKREKKKTTKKSKNLLNE